MTDGLSKRGNVSHSTEPCTSTSAQEWQSDSRAWSAIGVLLIGASQKDVEGGLGRAAPTDQVDRRVQVDLSTVGDGHGSAGGEVGGHQALKAPHLDGGFLDRHCGAHRDLLVGCRGSGLRDSHVSRRRRYSP
jgi:hypothetical protein